LSGTVKATEYVYRIFPRRFVYYLVIAIPAVYKLLCLWHNLAHLRVLGGSIMMFYTSPDKLRIHGAAEA